MKHPPGVESAFPKCDHCFCTFVHVHTHIHKHGSASDPAVRHTPLGVHPLPTARSHSAPRDTVSVLTEKTSIELQSREGSRTLDACTHVNVHTCACTHVCARTHTCMHTNTCAHTVHSHTRAHSHRHAHTPCTRTLHLLRAPGGVRHCSPARPCSIRPPSSCPSGGPSPATLPP